MTEPRALAWAVPCLLLLTACGGAETPSDDTATAKLPPAEAADERSQDSLRPAELPPAEASNERSLGNTVGAQRSIGATSRYTSLEPAACKLLEENAEAAGYWLRRCGGSAGYALETSESDLRQDVVIIAPGGRRSDLNLSNLVANGAFNRLGGTAEWRGLTPGQPRALIVRLEASPEGRRRISNLVVASLAEPSCVVAVIPPGPGQNEKARAIADGKLPACLKR